MRTVENRSDKLQGVVGPDGGTEVACRVHMSLREVGAQGVGLLFGIFERRFRVER